MMWDIGHGDQHAHSDHGSVRMPSPAFPSVDLLPPAHSDHGGHGHLSVPLSAAPSLHSIHSHAGFPSEPTVGIPLVRAISAEESHHSHRRTHSNPHPDIDRAIHLPPILNTHGHHHHEHRHHHHHSRSDGGHHYPTSHNDGGRHRRHSHVLTHPPPPPSHPVHRPQHQLLHAAVNPRIEHPPFHPNFIYSRCTGRKKALCIGINYRGERHELRGCINDAKAMRKFLIQRHGYKADDIVLLTDDNPNPRQQPTRRNMIDAMHWLVQSAKHNDSLFFHYSGHGGQTKDLDGDEIDGMDEVIYPVDFQQKGHILDDDLFKIMVRPLPAGCRLTALFDSCHSGTVLDLPFIYSASGRLRGSHVSQRARARRSSPGDVISFSACKDGQKSTDTFKGGVAVGAMSWAFCDVMAKNPNQSYQQILNHVKQMTYTKYHQTPQLGSSHHIDMNIRFII